MFIMLNYIFLSVFNFNIIIINYLYISMNQYHLFFILFNRFLYIYYVNLLL